MLSIILSTLFVSSSPIKPIITPKPRLAVQTQSAASLYRRVKPYVVTVKTSGGTGSGFITDEGLLYTAYHVVRGASKLTAVTGTGKSIPLKTVIAADVEQDWIP
jgi:S1-C subfamily serine protease